MSKWDNLPNEVLEQIIEKLEYHVAFNNKDEWPLVNKQWYSIFQSLAFKNISVDLDLTFEHDARARCIMNSVYQPGQWVKSIMLDDEDYDDSNQLTFEQGVRILFNFMLKTPNVQDVHLAANERDAELWWKYLERVLSISRSTWKILSIKTPCNSIEYPSFYFACVSLVKNTLEYLIVTEGMLGRQNLSRLHGFRNLTTLRVCPGVLQNIQELYGLMKQLPRLKMLKHVYQEQHLMKLIMEQQKIIHWFQHLERVPIIITQIFKVSV